MVNSTFKDLLSVKAGTIVCDDFKLELSDHLVGTVMADGEGLLIQGLDNKSLTFVRYLLGEQLGAFLVGWEKNGKYYFITTLFIDNGVYKAIGNRAIEVPNPNDKYLFGVPVNLQQI